MRAGFTLIEILVVTAIISVLSIATLLTLQSSTEPARIAAVQSQIDKIQAAIISYRIDTGQWPPDYIPNNAAAVNPLIIDPGIAGWRGPYGTYSDSHAWGGYIGFGTSPAGRAFILLDDDQPRTSPANNQGIIPDESLIRLDEILDNGNLATGDVVGDYRELPHFSAEGQLVIYIDD